MTPKNKFNRTTINPLYPHQASTTPAAAAAAAGPVPAEFPGLIYDVLRSYPDAMEAVAKAVKEFYEKRVPR